MPGKEGKRSKKTRNMRMKVCNTLGVEIGLILNVQVRFTNGSRAEARAGQKHVSGRTKRKQKKRKAEI